MVQVLQRREGLNICFLSPVVETWPRVEEHKPFMKMATTLLQMTDITSSGALESMQADDHHL